MTDVEKPVLDFQGVEEVLDAYPVVIKILEEELDRFDEVTEIIDKKDREIDELKKAVDPEMLRVQARLIAKAAKSRGLFQGIEERLTKSNRAFDIVKGQPIENKKQKKKL